MAMLQVLTWLLIAINIATGVMNLVNWRRNKRRRDAAHDQLMRFVPCVAMVAYLARPESGSSESLRTACAAIVPPDISFDFDIHPMPTMRTH